VRGKGNAIAKADEERGIASRGDSHLQVGSQFNAWRDQRGAEDPIQGTTPVLVCSDG
jgi:hypothetical protein